MPNMSSPAPLAKKMPLLFIATSTGVQLEKVWSVQL